MLLRMEVTEDTNTLYEYSGGLKCWHLSTDISKTSKPLPSFLKQSSIFEQNGWKWVLFGHNIAWGVGAWRDEPKPVQ